MNARTALILLLGLTALSCSESGTTGPGNETTVTTEGPGRIENVPLEDQAMLKGVGLEAWKFRFTIPVPCRVRARIAVWEGEKESFHGNLTLKGLQPGEGHILFSRSEFWKSQRAGIAIRQDGRQVATSGAGYAKYDADGRSGPLQLMPKSGGAVTSRCLDHDIILGEELPVLVLCGGGPSASSSFETLEQARERHEKVVSLMVRFSQSPEIAEAGTEHAAQTEDAGVSEALERLVGQVMKEYELVFGDRARQFRDVPSDPEARAAALYRQVMEVRQHLVDHLGTDPDIRCLWSARTIWPELKRAVFGVEAPPEMRRIRISQGKIDLDCTAPGFEAVGRLRNSLGDLDVVDEIHVRELLEDAVPGVAGKRFELVAGIDPEHDRLEKLDREGRPQRWWHAPVDLPGVDVASLSGREQRLARALSVALPLLGIARSVGDAFHAPDRGPEEFFAQALHAARVPLSRSRLQTPAKERIDRRRQAVDTVWPLSLRDVTLTQLEALMAELELQSMRGRVIELDLRRKDVEAAKWDVDLHFGYRVAARR